MWLFFDTAVAAGLARRLGALLLTETMDHRPDLGFRSYDRFFPSQDTLPHGGFGNLIALPLQGQPRKSVDSVFVDADLNPFPDQWAYLSQLGRVPASQAESLVREAEKEGRVLGVKAVESDELLASAPWKAPPSRRLRAPPVTGPLPEAVEIVLGDGIYIAKQDLPPGILARLMRLAAFQNPEFYRAQAMRLPTWDKPRIVDYVEGGPEFIRLPRGCLDDARHLLRRLGISVFQCRLTARRRVEMVSELDTLIHHGDDHVLIVDLGPADKVSPRVESLGKRFDAVAREPIIV